MSFRALALGSTVLLSVAATPQGQTPFAVPRDPQTFYLALLQKGPAWTTTSSPELDALQQSHLAHLTRLATTGRAAIAGPFGDDGDIRGIVILKAASIDEARVFEAEDPAVKAGRLRIDVWPFAVAANWFEFAPVKENYAMRQFAVAFLKSSPDTVATGGEETHLAYLWTLRQGGVLVLAGSFVGENAARVLEVFAVDGVDKARALATADPLVASGRLTAEIHPWFAADGIMKNAK